MEIVTEIVNPGHPRIRTERTRKSKRTRSEREGVRERERRGENTNAAFSRQAAESTRCASGIRHFYVRDRGAAWLGDFSRLKRTCLDNPGGLPFPSPSPLRGAFSACSRRVNVACKSYLPGFSALSVRFSHRRETVARARTRALPPLRDGA